MKTLPMIRRRKPGWSGWLARTALLLASSLLALLWAELLLRACVEQEAKRLAIYDHELGWRGKPGGTGVYLRRQDGIKTSFRYNRFGFRDGEVSEKTMATPRIVMLGDSFLESLEVPLEQTFHSLVERRLQDRTGDDADVVALGSQGYSNAQQLLAFRRYKDHIDADIVLSVFYSGNDFEDNIRPRFATLDEHQHLQFPANNRDWIRETSQGFQRWLYENSHLVFLAKNTLERSMQWRFTDPSKISLQTGSDYKLQITEQLLLQTRIETAAAGASYGLILIPSRDEIQDQDLERIRFVRDLCNSHDIPILDLSQCLHLEHYFPIDVHFNASGHRLVAEKIDEFLCDRFAARLTRVAAIGETPRSRLSR